MVINRFRIVALLAFATGCGAIIGTPDLDYDGNASQGRATGNGGLDGSTTTPPTNPTTTPPTPNTCDETKLATDRLNCGYCGHDCVGGDCVEGKCQAVKLGSVAGAPLRHIAVGGDYVFASTVTTLTTQTGKLWRVPKAGGVPAMFVDHQNAAEMAVVDGKLYFANEQAQDEGDSGVPNGGLYTCDVNAAIPCTPGLIAAAEDPSLVVANQSKIYFDDYNLGIRVHTPGGQTVPFRERYPSRMWIDNGNFFFLTWTDPSSDEEVHLMSLPTNATPVTDPVELTSVQIEDVTTGRITGNADDVFFTAWVYEKSTGGKVRRVGRNGLTAACDYGGDSNKRPYGIHVDQKYVYWTNQGNPTEPYADGSVAYCPIGQAGECCETPIIYAPQTGEPSAMAGDDKAIYWVTYRTSEIWKIAKP